MNAQELKKEILDHYLDQDLQVTIVRDPGKWTTGNGLIHIGIFYTLLSINKISDREDQERFTDAVMRCWAHDDNGMVWGLLNRNPGRMDLEGQDDYIGIYTGSYFVNSRIAGWLFSYGEDHHFSYDNSSPDHFSWKTWHGRFLGLVGFYRMCDGRMPGWLQSVGIKIWTYFGCSDDASETIKEWLQILVIERYSEKKFEKQVKRWKDSFLKKWETMDKVFAAYFGKDHPFAKTTITVDGTIV